ncbi:IclR family transcriptional regulator [Pseudochelatococcus sp. G4_1912]|uniref:IclR family transcriptional regulator n=1 Tax=Pseudochelatococcus sp. G4_1912 TaxID=3114288 RepID=UPI0039C6E3BF
MPNKEPEQDAGRGKDGTQAITRALDILTLLAMGHAPKWGLKISEISTYLGMSRPTVHRILNTLTERGFAQKIEKSGRYVIGTQVPLLALARERKLPLLQLAEPYLQEVSRIVHDTVFFSMRSERDVLTIARVMGDFPIQVLSIDVGDRRPLGAITSGVAILTQFDDAQSTQMVEQDELRLAAFNYTVPDVLAFVRESRERGFAYRQKGLIPGTKAIAIPVGGPNDPVMAAVTVSGMAKRMTEANVKEIIDDVRAECNALALRLHQKLGSNISTI